jgi:hypothetical protein
MAEIHVHVTAICTCSTYATVGLLLGYVDVTQTFVGK